MHRTSLAALIAFLFTCLPVLAQTFTGKVTAVTDGDTVKVLVKGLKGQREVKVRLHGIDCPESHQAFGAKAKQFTSDFAFGKDATVDVRDTDKYGRQVAEVLIAGKSLNAAIVDAGLAWAYVEYSRDFVDNERKARLAKKGLWADPRAVAPWDFRHGTVGKVGGNNTSGGSIAKSKAPSTKSTASRAQTVPEESVRGATVYITRTGAKYHLDGCRYLARSRIPISRSEAIKSYAPCAVCQP